MAKDWTLNEKAATLKKEPEFAVLVSLITPIVTGTHRILETQTFDMNEYRRQNDKLEFEAMKRSPNGWRC